MPIVSAAAIAERRPTRILPAASSSICRPRGLAALSADGRREAERRLAEAELKRIRAARAALAPRMSAQRAARAALAARRRAGRDLVTATEDALAAWRESHQKVVRAVRERQPVSFQSLAAASEDIRGLIGQAKAAGSDRSPSRELAVA